MSAYIYRKMVLKVNAVLLMLLMFSFIKASESSLFDPHLFPEKGPFFEGWYLRLSDFDNGDSIGLLFGSVLPDSAETVTGPLVLASILWRNCDANASCTLVAANGAFNTTDLGVAVGGNNVTANPDIASPSNFRWEVNDGYQGGYLFQDSGNTSVDFMLGNISLRFNATEPYPWNSEGTGPEGGFIGIIPLPLHWFVFSLRSPVVNYELQDFSTGEVRMGNGTVHMEKNWGGSFPKSWIWSEGVSPDDSNASFAIAGGAVDFWITSVDAYLIGYRNPSAGLSLDFHPTDSFVSTQIDGCSGSVNFTVNSLWYKVQISISGRGDSFSSCLYGPEVNGFQRACVESYDARATFVVYQRTFFSGYKTLDRQTFTNIALEFGGTNVCRDACAGK